MPYGHANAANAGGSNKGTPEAPTISRSGQISRGSNNGTPQVILVEMESVISDAALMHVAITRARFHFAVIGSEAVVLMVAQGPPAVEGAER